MFRPTAFRSALPKSTSLLRPTSRALSASPRILNSSSPGSNARTDPTVKIPLPTSVPASNPITRAKPTLPTFSLEGKTAIITGGARGLGYVMTQALLESGANVAIVDLNGPEALSAAQKLKAHFAESGDESSIPQITAHQCDVADPYNVTDVFEEIYEAHSDRADILVTSAGFCENFAAHEYPPDRMQKLWDVNVSGTYYCAAELARHLIQREAPGSIVMIGSMSGAVVNVPQPQAPYNASKAAVRQLAASMAVEWASYGIRVNCISPGYMLTDLTKKILEDKPDLKAKWTSLIPQGKMGVPSDLMGAVVFLASDAAGYVTGSDLRVDGGYTVA